jgi:ammonia channel protein AmtB
MYGGQYSLAWIISDAWYYIAAFMVLLAIVGLSLIDLGQVRRENIVHSAVQKLAAVLAGGFGMMLVGYAIWQVQFNQAFGVADPFWSAIRSWWLGGSYMTAFSVDIDPKVLPEADVLQIFFVFFVTFGMLGGALLHGALRERIKTVPLMIASFIVNGLLQPVVAYFCWGSVGPLTNKGFHDFAAITSLYLTIGAFTIALNLVTRPRLGRFDPQPVGSAVSATSPLLSMIGVLVVITAIPFIMVGNGYFIADSGFYGIAFNTSGVGLMASNLVLAFVGGGLAGLVISLVRREFSWVMYGPLAGYIITGTLIDVADPWQTFLVSLFGPVFMLIGSRILHRLRIDDDKAALAVLPGAVGIVITGFIAWGTKQGGYPGLKGEYAFQGAQITPGMQLLGAVLVLVAGFVAGLIVAYALKFTTGLRMKPEVELAQDAHYWHIAPTRTADVTPEPVPVVAD